MSFISAKLQSILLFLIPICLDCSPGKKDREEIRIKPNVIFILVDDLGWTDLGCYGSTFYETPHIDALAEKSALFVNAYTSSPVCSPTRASILTGKYPSRLGITDWIPGRRPKDQKLLGPTIKNELPLEEMTLAEVFKQADYNTFYAGKWHLGSEGFFPEDQGFDINIGGHHRGSPPGGYYTPYNNPKMSDGPDGEYLTDRLTDETIQFIRKNKDKPFFTYLAYYTVHTPIQPNKKYVGQFEEKRLTLDDSLTLVLPEHDAITVQNQRNTKYASMVYALDKNIGKLMGSLEELNLMDNTIIVFTSDNGGLSTLYSRKAPTSVKPLRGGKGWCYEGGIKVPLLIKKPGNDPGLKIETPVISTDFFPTLIEMAGLASNSNESQDGCSLVPILNGNKELQRESLLWYFPHYHGSGWRPGAAVRVGDWKLIEFYDHEKIELYHIANDPEEKNELSESHPDKVVELKATLEQMLKNTNASPPISNE
jgi:arylsulfatase A-like enzyme